MKLSIERILCFFIAVSICFQYNIQLKIENYIIQQYIILLPALFLLFVLLVFLKRKTIRFSIMFLIFICIFIFLITGFKLGIQYNDLISLFGMLLIPFMILIFNNINSDDIIYDFIIIFTMMELIIIIIIAKDRTFFDIKNHELRNMFFSWPNYFAMLSTIKYGYLYKLKKSKKLIKNLYAFFVLTSIIIIFTSLSRTAMGMLFIILLLRVLFYYKEGERINVSRRMLIVILLLIILIVFSYLSVTSKNLSPGATTMRTIENRLWRWEIILNTVKDNLLFGIGFRSVTNYIDSDIGSSHNDYLDILVKGGVIGFISLYAFFIRRALKLAKSQYYTDFGIIISILASSVVQNPLKNISIMVLFCVSLANSYKTSNLAN